jgi:chromosomal replication initiator protein
MGLVFIMPTTALRAKRIMAETAALYGVKVIDLVSQRRDALTSRARQHCYWTMRHETTWSLPRIGKMFGDRDHTSILHGVRRHQARIDAGEVMP